MRAIHVLLLLILGFSVLPVQAQVANDRDHRILVLGDSLSAAHNIPRDRGWVALLRQRLAQHDGSWTVINASISGETTSGGLTRLPGLLKQHHPGWVLIELGANDGLRGLPLKVIHANLKRLIDQSRGGGAKVILLGIMLPPNYGPVYAKPFAAMYQDLARQEQVPLVPFLLAGVAQQRELMQRDGLHPTAAGEPKVLDNVWQVAAPLWGLASTTTKRKGDGS